MIASGVYATIGTIGGTVGSGRKGDIRFTAYLHSRTNVLLDFGTVVRVRQSSHGRGELAQILASLTHSRRAALGPL